MGRHAVQEWRDIPGYDGVYQISRMGEVRTWFWRGKRLLEPRMMRQYNRVRSANGNQYFVKLVDKNGASRNKNVLALMVDTWLGGQRPGLVPYHKNGDLRDHCLHNIGFTTRQKLGQITGAKARRRPVVKISPDGEIVEVYSSARAAARANAMSYQAVLDRCHSRVKNPFAADGYDYRFDDDGRKQGRGGTFYK